MSEKKLNQILKQLGRKVQEEQYENPVKPHEFSDEYKNKKQQLLQSLDVKKTRKIRRPLGVVAALAVVVCASLTVYAATKMIDVMLTANETEDSVAIAVSKKTDDYIAPIEITPEYLPDEYAEWVKGKYSLNGEWAGDGLTIVDAGYYQNYTVPDVSEYEEQQIGEAKAVILNRVGYGYPWQIYLFYETTGHVIQIFGSEELSKEEMLKVCENITYKEVPEKDPDRTYQAFAYEEVETVEAEATILNEADLLDIDMQAICYGHTEDNERISEDVKYSVKSIDIGDTADTSLLNADTVYDYEEVMKYIEGDGTFAPYIRSVSEWTGSELVDKELATVTVKNVDVVIEVTNATETDYTDVNMQPQWMLLRQEEAGYLLTDEFDGTHGYEPGEDFRGGSYYGVSADGFAYYFDSSAFPQDSHFHNMSIGAGETKEVHLSFAIQEDLIGEAYLVFSIGCEGYTRFIKVVS